MLPSMIFEVKLDEIQNVRLHNVSSHINLYQNQFINECARKNFP